MGKRLQTSLREWKIVGIHEQLDQRYSRENFQQSKEKMTLSYEGMQQEDLSKEATQESLEETGVGLEFKGRKVLPSGEKTSSIEEKDNLHKLNRIRKKLGQAHSLDKTESYSQEHYDKDAPVDKPNLHKANSSKHHVVGHQGGHDLPRKKVPPALKKTPAPHKLAVQKALLRNRDLVYKQKIDAQKGSREQLSKENLAAQKMVKHEHRPSKISIGNPKPDFRQGAPSPKKVKPTARQSKHAQGKFKDVHRQSHDMHKCKVYTRQKGVKKLDGR
ncbi:hypothetical protein Y032_0039g121 [Ancylostoma ceylanicum]|nr:hypothetical protein Y032_0039g121 [Ancylostoma ceylanicum]